MMDANQRKWVIIGAIVVGALGLALILYLNVRPEPPIQGVVQSPRPSRGHDNGVVFAAADYPVPPPGGIHWDTWQNCGVYDESIETGHALHSLEHGAVWITYQPNLPANEVAVLRSWVEDDAYLLLSPYPGQPSPVVLTAWGVQLEVDDVNDGRIARFIDRYRQGPFTPEPGAACDRGVGSPLDRTPILGWRTAMPRPLGIVGIHLTRLVQSS
ncbi:MAG: DUF3105 domain-containing protein [Anaerolineae bacterium]|nr:DUF3105 domain-containing protein [Anaerolineae bacterium]